MKIGIDLDGTISKAGLYNPSLRLPCWLFIFLVPLAVLIRPNEKTVQKLREFAGDGYKIIIVSARPPWMLGLTKRWLKNHKIPFAEIFCIGFGKGTKQRKLDVIRKEEIDQFFDDNKRLVDFLTQHSIKATNIFS